MFTNPETSDEIATETVAAAHPRRRLVKKAALVAAASAALTCGAVGVAQAAQLGYVGPGQSHSYSTWFWGRTQVCFKNIDATNDASYYWTSATSAGGGGLTPGAETCMTRSFVGFPINVANLSARATIQVRFPIGP